MFHHHFFFTPFTAAQSSQRLLTDADINKLIHAATLNKANHTAQLSSRGRFGEQLAATTGSGSDFAEVRAYHYGDDPRHIDWRATARSQVPLLRTYHNEFSQPFCLLIDRRSAMRFATRKRLKVTQALRAALWLGGREARSGREISIVILDTPCHWLPPQQGLLSLKLLSKLANPFCPPIEPDQTHEISWKAIFSGLKQHIPQGSEVILLSDFSGLGTQDDKMLRMLGNYCRVKAIKVFDPSEAISEEKLNPFVSMSIQLQWGQQVRNIKSLNDLKNNLLSRSEQMRKSFQQANISYLQLSVEQDDLNICLGDINEA